MLKSVAGWNRFQEQKIEGVNLVLLRSLLSRNFNSRCHPYWPHGNNRMWLTWW